jgi:hypothetical protein
MAPRRWAPRTGTFLNQVSRSNLPAIAANVFDRANPQHKPFSAAPDWHGAPLLGTQNRHFS